VSNRVYRVVFGLPNSQSGRVLVIVFNPINNGVRFMLNPFA